MASSAPLQPSYSPRHIRPWRGYRDRRQHQPIPTASALLTVIPSLPRPMLGRLVAKMIDRMDYLDGDPDTDACEAQDDAGSYRARPLGRIGFDGLAGHSCEDREQDEATEDEEGEGLSPFWSR